jgi:hypothetical protein
MAPILRQFFEPKGPFPDIDNSFGATIDTPGDHGGMVMAAIYSRTRIFVLPDDGSLSSLVGNAWLNGGCGGSTWSVRVLILPITPDRCDKSGDDSITMANRISVCDASQSPGLESLVSTFRLHSPTVWRDVEWLVVLGGPLATAWTVMVAIRSRASTTVLLVAMS